jgi:hypothetical protein
MNLNLYFAVFWLLVGAGLLVWPAVDPQVPRFQILETGLSAGWFGIVLGLYNVSRWWSIRTAARQRQVREEMALRHAGEQPRRPPQEPDPNFNFTEPSGDRSTPDTPSH